MPTLDIHTLQRLRRVLNLSAIAEEAGLNKNTLLAKVARGRELTAEEAAKISQVLIDQGLDVSGPTFRLPDGTIDHVALSKVSKEERHRFLASLALSTPKMGDDEIIQTDTTIIDY